MEVTVTDPPVTRHVTKPHTTAGRTATTPEPSTSITPGHWLVGADNGTFSIGAAPFLDSISGLGISASGIIAPS
jgi:hypothetical protein